LLSGGIAKARTLATALAGIISLGNVAVAAEARPASPERTCGTVQSILDEYFASGKIAGAVVALGRGESDPIFIAAGSISDLPGAPRAGPASLWRIYSMTKPITAMAAMTLVEDGKLSLDQPIADFMPEFGAMRVLTAPETSLQARPARQSITVRHLLTHTGGLTYQFLGRTPIHKAYEDLGLLGGRTDPAAAKAQPQSLEEFSRRLARLPLISEPGTKWNYSVGTDVLGRVIEVASGVSFERYVEQRLLKPLGMTSTYWTVPRSEASRLATLYAWSEKRVVVDPGDGSIWMQPPAIHYGGSGLVSSARDYDRFLQMLAGSGKVGRVRVLKSRTVRLAMSNLLPAGVRMTGAGTPEAALAEGYGAGGWVYLADTAQGIRAGTYGWFGAAGTIAFVDPVAGIRLTLMTNYFPGDKWPLGRDLIAAVYSADRRAPLCARSASGPSSLGSSQKSPAIRPLASGHAVRSGR